MSIEERARRAHNKAGAVNTDRIVMAAIILVELWENPTIKGLPRSERNTAIEEARGELMAAIQESRDLAGFKR